MTVIEWASRWQIPHAALLELAALPEPYATTPALITGRPETYVQQQVRLEAAQKGVHLFRNNVGALKDENGRLVRYGLANDSKAMNESVKSGDLIGFRCVTITESHLGSVIAQFLSRECKRESWSFDPSNARDAAQLRWATFVNSRGGDAALVRGVGSL